MGDRCFLSLTFHKNDTEKIRLAGIFGSTEEPFEKHFDHIYRQEEGSAVNVSIDEANYGCPEEIIALVDAKINFYGAHGSGGDYGAAEFACLDGEYIEVPSYGGPMVLVNEDGNPNPKGLERVRRYYQILNQLRSTNAATPSA